MNTKEDFIKKHEDEGLYIVMDFINQEYPEFKTKQECEEYIKDIFIDETEGIHPDIENVIIVEKKHFIFIDEEKGLDDCDISLCDFPSQLLKQRDEMRELLKDILSNSRNTEDVCFIPEYLEDEINEFIESTNP